MGCESDLSIYWLHLILNLEGAKTCMLIIDFDLIDNKFRINWVSTEGNNEGNIKVLQPSLQSRFQVSNYCIFWRFVVILSLY